MLNVHVKSDLCRSLQVGEGSVAPVPRAGLTLYFVQLRGKEEEMADLPMMCVEPAVAEELTQWRTSSGISTQRDNKQAWPPQKLPRRRGSKPEVTATEEVAKDRGQKDGGNPSKVLLPLW